MTKNIKINEMNVKTTERSNRVLLDYLETVLESKVICY